MRSDTVKAGYQKAPHRSLLRAAGVKGEDFPKPFIAVCSSYTDVVPGHCHLRAVADLIKDEIRAAGGVPFEFDTIAVCDGIAMGHAGMKMSLPSRELIADSVETMLRAHCFDGVICIPNCDKIVPGMPASTPSPAPPPTSTPSSRPSPNTRTAKSTKTSSPPSNPPPAPAAAPAPACSPPTP